MRRYWTAFIAVAALCSPTARGQSFPFEDAFTAYTPGSTGAPAWSILDGNFSTREGALTGPVTIRFNARPPGQFVADMTLDLRGEDAMAPEAAVYLNHQHDADTSAADVVILRAVRDSAGQMELLTAVDRTGEASSPRQAAMAALPEGTVSLRVIVDAAAGRASVLLDGKPALTAAPMEYAAGLFSIRLGDGASLDRIILRAPTGDEKRSVMLTKLFNDPRDLADADGGHLLVLHRGSHAVLTVTPDGEVTRSFGRRAPGGIPDPVALERGPHGEVIVLNRVPGEVVVFDRNGGIRHRFGSGRLREPSDFAVLPDGTMYVAEPAAGRIAVFGSDRRYLGEVTSFGTDGGTPIRVGRDPFGNVVVMVTNPDRVVVLRPGPNRVSMSLVSETPGEVADVVSAGGRLLAYRGDSIVEWASAAGGPAFRADAVGGIQPGGRLGIVGETVYALDRSQGRLVAVPESLEDAKPSVSFLNLAQSAALVRWTSGQPTLSSRVRVSYDGRAYSEKVTNKAPTTDHQVPLSNLKPGRTYQYAVAPTVATIPPTDWSVEYTLETSGTAAPEVDATPATPEAASTSPTAGATGGTP